MLDGVAPFLAAPHSANSATDTEKHLFGELGHTMVNPVSVA